MFRLGWKLALIGVVAAVLLAAASSADAAWWNRCDGCYSPCGWGGYDGCGYGGGWYLGWRPGPIRRLVFGPYRWYYGGGYYGGYGAYYGGYYSGCGWSDVYYYDPCCTVVGFGGVTPPTTPIQTAPIQQPTPAAKPEKPEMPPPEAKPKEPGAGTIPEEPPTKKYEPPMPPTKSPAEPPAGTTPGLKFDTPMPPPERGTTPAPPTGSSYFPTQAESGLLTVYVPYEAKVFVNGMETRSIGSRRQYVSYGLIPGYNYKYEVKVQVVREGKLVEDSRSVILMAGQRQAVAFGFNKPSEEVAATR